MVIQEVLKFIEPETKKFGNYYVNSKLYDSTIEIRNEKQISHFIKLIKLTKTN